MLESKQKELKKIDKGNRPFAAQTLIDAERNTLFVKQQLGTHSPQAVMNTLWHFGSRGVDEQKKLEWGDLSMKKDEQGTEDLEFNETDTKTRTGDDVRNIRQVKPRMWPNKPDPLRCPVVTYKHYARKRPVRYSEPHHPFYTASSSSFHEGDAIVSDHVTWFRAQPKQCSSRHIL